MQSNETHWWSSKICQTLLFFHAWLLQIEQFTFNINTWQWMQFRVRLCAKPHDWVSAFGANYSILEKLFSNFILLLMSSLFIFCFSKHDLPSLKCSDQEWIADFQLKKDIRLNHPGACSLEFQNVMQIIMDCMLRWDSKNQTSKGKGILRTVLEFSAADEEQGRETLHPHWQIWVKEYDQTLRNSLFQKT